MEGVEATKQIVQRYVDAFNHGDVDKMLSVCAPGAQVHGVLGWGGMNEAAPVWRELHDAFGLKLTVEEMVAEGNRVAVRYRESGQFARPFRGHAPTGKAFEHVGMEWFDVQDGRIQRRWNARLRVARETNAVDNSPDAGLYLHRT